MGLLQKIVISSIVTAVSILGGSVYASPSSKDLDVKLQRLYKDGPVSKLDIINSVKKKFEGRILSVRKKYEDIPENTCHIVKLIDGKGELLILRVGCT